MEEKEQTHAKEHSFNRTFMELKLSTTLKKSSSLQSFNRTFMELKSENIA